MIYLEDAREDKRYRSYCKICNFHTKSRGFSSRDLKILEMRTDKKTLDQIGYEIGLSRERVRMILRGIFRLLRSTVDE